MPVYEYKCLSCGGFLEIVQRYNELPPACPECGKEMKKLISSTSFVLKGTGWYKTDYASGRNTSAPEKKGNGEKSEAKPESKSEAKSETKSEKTSENKVEAAAKT